MSLARVTSIGEKFFVYFASWNPSHWQDSYVLHWVISLADVKGIKSANTWKKYLFTLRNNTALHFSIICNISEGQKGKLDTSYATSC